MKLIKLMFTGIDGVTYDPARVMWIVGLVTALAFTGYEVYNTKHFNITDFCLAYGGLLAAGAGAVKVKEATVLMPDCAVHVLQRESTYCNAAA